MRASKWRHQDIEANLRKFKNERGPLAYRANHSCTVCRATPYRRATSVTGAPSLTSSTTRYRYSTTPSSTSTPGALRRDHVDRCEPDSILETGSAPQTVAPEPEPGASHQAESHSLVDASSATQSDTPQMPKYSVLYSKEPHDLRSPLTESNRRPSPYHRPTGRP
jgi:hypothetical protein